MRQSASGVAMRSREAVFCFLAAISASVPSNGAPTVPPTGSDFSYEDLKSLIQTGKLTSIEALLPLLPADFRSNYTLMRVTRSLQDASDLNPRAILFGKNAKLVCTFNGDPEQKGFDTLECEQFRDLERRFDFRQIQFPTAKNKLSQVLFSATNRSADGRASCTSCHSKDPRPNWNAYRTWPGAYGERDDELDPSDPYEDFVAKRDGDVRYKWLIQGPSRGSPYFDMGTIESRPNLRFSELIGRWNALRARRLLASKTEPWETLGFAVQNLRCAVEEAQLDQLKRVDPTFDFSELALQAFSKLGLSRNQFGTQTLSDVDGTGFAPYDHQAGYGYLASDVALVVARDLAQAGNRPLQAALRAVTDRYARDLVGKERDFFLTADSIAPDADVGTARYFDNVHGVCAELVPLFMDAYATAHPLP